MGGRPPGITTGLNLLNRVRVSVSLPQAPFKTTKMTTEMPITLETLYAEILEIKTLLRSAPPALAASVAKKVSKVSKKTAAAAAAAEDSAPAEPKAPSTNPWILFTKRVEGLIRAKEEAEGVAKEAKMKTVAAKQFASDLKGRKPYAEWADEEIVAALDGWAPPAVSKQAAEGKSKKQKTASAASSVAGSEAGSDDEAEAPAAPAKKRGPKKVSEMTPEEKAAHDAKVAERRAKKEAEKKAAAPALTAGGAAEDAEEEAEAPAAPAKKPIAIKPKAKPAEAAPAAKKVDLRFYSWTHGGTDYFTNDRGDVVTTEFEWVGRYNGEKIDESAPEPADLANAEMRE